MRFLKKALDLSLATLIAVVLVTAYVVYLFNVPRDRRPDSRLIALAVNTTIVFGFLLSWLRHQWKSSRFWVVLGLLFFCHIALFAILLRRIEHVPLATYVLTNSVELAIFSGILWKLPRFPKSGPD